MSTPRFFLVSLTVCLAIVLAGLVVLAIYTAPLERLIARGMQPG